MDVHNFQLNDIFNQNAKKYTIMPVMAEVPAWRRKWILCALQQHRGIHKRVYDV